MSKFEKNKHYWALWENELVIVICTNTQIKGGMFFVCGDWECHVDTNDIVLLKEILRPKGYESHKLMYGDYR